ncbi:uncharacterized protein [Rutidosis leptorrhynchoides]|uniref:uncharacterized protein n=1 Tax=Rutidosis leptorrhynchoides TaxID=125765 RepID=UPI003A99CD98
MMQQHEQNEDLGFCPSFNCYSSDTLSSTAAARISTQLQQHAVPLDDFEFSFNELSDEHTISDDRTVFPLFNQDLLTRNQIDHEQKANCTDTLANLFNSERAESVSSLSVESEGEEASGVSCVWGYKTDTGLSSLSKCKKSSSTGSGSKRWRIRDLLRRSNSEGKEPIMLLTDNSNKKKVDAEVSKQNRSSGELAVVSAGRSKPSVHELFYVQQRAKREGGKRNSYLPYRQDLVGLFSSNVNGKGNKFPFW